MFQIKTIIIKTKHTSDNEKPKMCRADNIESFQCNFKFTTSIVSREECLRKLVIKDENNNAAVYVGAP